MELSVIERRTLKKLEKEIEKDLASFLSVGQKLMEIRDKKLYREGFDTFEKYVSSRFEIQKSHAYRLIEAAEVQADLSPMGDILPANERQYRELAKVPDDVVCDVWKDVIKESEETGEPPTAKKIKEKVAELAVDEFTDSEPKPPKKPDKEWTFYQQKAVGACEVLIRLIDDVKRHKPSKAHATALKLAQGCWKELREW